MTLEQALLISIRPRSFNVTRLERAVRILRRWAESPCSNNEYRIRLYSLALVYLPYREKMDMIEAEQMKFQEALARMHKHHIQHMKELERKSKPENKAGMKNKSVLLGRNRRVVSQKPTISSRS
jgi:hypothetical protein